MSTETGKRKTCGYNTYKRTNYFHGMLLTERDFLEEQLYHQEKRKLLNRMLHGWGVVCGLMVKATEPPSTKIVITRGLALDCLGNEIVVSDDFELDLKKLPLPCPDPATAPPCPENTTAEETSTYYLGIKYVTAPTDPVPVYLPGGSCEEKSCEYSRIREGFCLQLLKKVPCVPGPLTGSGDDLLEKIAQCCPETPGGQEKVRACLQEVLAAFQTAFYIDPYNCPLCCGEDEPYVILGSLTLKKDCQTPKIESAMINIHAARRYVLTPPLWQYILRWFAPQVSSFLDNPFSPICRKTISGLTESQLTAICGLVHRLKEILTGGEAIPPKPTTEAKELMAVIAANKAEFDKKLAEMEKSYKSQVEELKKLLEKAKPVP